ncbi:T9SS type A sorting domain-containing protein, partial [Aureispira]|nr:T9SS type A sorting domain-containing protein [Aureispira sp.]
AIGAYYNNGNGTDAGHVRIYEWNGTNWIQKGVDIDGEVAGDRSGSVSMPDAQTVAIGAFLNDGNGSNTGHVRIYSLKGVSGNVYQDFNQNCVRDINEIGISNTLFNINPGNIIITSNSSGTYSIDSLPAGSYTITVDTTNPNWITTCPATQSFTVVHPDSLTQGPDFGYVSAYPCNQPNVSIVMPLMRRGFSNNIYVQACNENTATDFIDSAYCIVELLPEISFQNASLPYTALGNNQYYFYLDTLYPGQCVNFTILGAVDSSVLGNTTLCMSAELYPQDSCIFDTTYTPFGTSPLGSVGPCPTTYDRSDLTVESSCVGDSVRFVIRNNYWQQSCYTPVRVYLDGQCILLDSIRLGSWDSTVYMFEGLAGTWVLEADQHPLYPGVSHPSAHMENCGVGLWTPGIITQFPANDGDPIVDIYCGQVNVPLDPNDKAGYPNGLTTNHYIQQNQDLEYLIRFQNVGTDTAVNIVIRDTLSTDLNIFTVTSGVSSFPYDFRMYGQRILEWTFNNIMLPDSNVNEPASHGFVKFSVDQVPNLPYGTVIENSAAIYFDFEAPVITNTYFHTIHDFSIIVSVEKTQSIDGFEAILIPNPVSDYATLYLYGLKDYSNIDIQMFDMTGRKVNVLSNQESDKIPLKVNNLSKGIYVVQVLQAGRSVGVLKMVVN